MENDNKSNIELLKNDNNSSENYSQTKNNSKGETEQNKSSTPKTQAQIIGGKQGKSGEKQTEEAWKMMDALSRALSENGLGSLGDKVKRINDSFRDDLLSAKDQAISTGVKDSQKIFTQKSQMNFIHNSLDNNQALEIDRALNNSVNSFIGKQVKNKSSIATSVNNYGEMVGDVIQSPRLGEELGKIVKEKYNLGKKDMDKWNVALDKINEFTNYDNMGLLYDSSDYKRYDNGTLIGGIDDEWANSFVDEKARKFSEKGWWGKAWSNTTDFLEMVAIATSPVVWIADIAIGIGESIFGSDDPWKSLNATVDLIKEKGEDLFGGGKTDEFNSFIDDIDFSSISPSDSIKIVSSSSGINENIINDAYNENKHNIDISESSNHVDNIINNINETNNTLNEFSVEITNSIIDTIDQKGKIEEANQQVDKTPIYQKTNKNNEMINKLVKEELQSTYYYDINSDISTANSPITKNTIRVEETPDEINDAMDSLTGRYSKIEYVSPEMSFSKLFGSGLNGKREATRTYASLMNNKVKNNDLTII